MSHLRNSESRMNKKFQL